MTIELCEEAVYECFEHKWNREDVLAFIEKYAGIRRQEMWKLELEDPQNRRLKNEAADSIAAYLYDTICDLRKDIEPEDMEEVIIKRRPDGMTGKMRDIATLCILHQLLGHAVKLMLMPLFYKRMEPTQHASIPGRGQTKLKNQIHQVLRSHPEIKYTAKTDVKSAYKSLKYRVCTKLVQREIPKAKDAICILTYLGKIAPGGHLIIGGYLDAWLFNFAMSYAIRYIKTLGSVRREKFIPACSLTVTYMDDFGLHGASRKGIEKTIKKLDVWMQKELQISIKVTAGVTKLLPIEEEKRRRRRKGAAKGCPSVDMGGFRICRSHVTCRKRVFRKTRRQFLRAWKEYQKEGTLRVWRAQKVISSNGPISQTDAWKIEEKYHVKELVKVAKRVTAYHERQVQKKRKEKIQHALYSGSSREAAQSYN